jgi:alcohol dehydrogenase (cytochrome c)
MRSLTVFVFLVSGCSAVPQDSAAGRTLFENRCASCHGADGNGGEFGPAIVARVSARNDIELAEFLRAGIPNRGMPAFALREPEMNQLIAHLRTLGRPQTGALAPPRIKVQTTTGASLEGLLLGEGVDDVQLRSDDGGLHILRRSGERFRPVTSQVDWSTYDGDYKGNRYSTLRQIDRSNVGRLGPKWIFPMDDTTPLQTTPIVFEGVMYVTTANQCFALDPGTGRQIWHFQRPRTRGVIGNASGGINRGAAAAAGHVFMATDNGHLLALNRFTGSLVWEKEMADFRQNYAATAAPLAIGDLIISGIAGGDQGARGFVVAYDQATGAERWRFWAAPLPGEPGSETWKGSAIEHPGAPTWMNGSYDPELGLLYWPIGNPGPDLNGDERLGDNLYSCSVVALDIKTGKLRWYFQFTPHDEWDWDAQQPMTLIDTMWEGHPRKLLLDANRNGFFYVLDRTDGKLLLAKPFVQKLNWAREIGPDGRPVLNSEQRSSAAGTRICPSLIGAANWWSTAFNPATGLYYVQALESCAIYTRRDAKQAKWEPGRGFAGGSSRESPDDRPKKFLRAIDIGTGKIAWELPEPGPGTTRGGVLATAGGVVFFCADSDAFMAVDAATSKPLWHFQANHFWRASPMTYVFDNHQYVAVASGPNIIAFGLPD